MIAAQDLLSGIGELVTCGFTDAQPAQVDGAFVLELGLLALRVLIPG